MFCSGIPRDHPRKSPLKFYYVKYMGIKSDDTADFGEHVIISYLLWFTLVPYLLMKGCKWDVFQNLKCISYMWYKVCCTCNGTTGNTSENSSQEQNLTCNNITCREGFYCKEDANNSNTLCSPSYHTWKQYPHATNIATDVLVLMSACIGVISGVGVLVVAGIRRKNVYVLILIS